MVRAKNNSTNNENSDAHAALNGNASNNNGNGSLVRTTVILPDHLYWTVTAWCARERLRKGDGLVELIKAGLGAKGLQPDKGAPKIKITY
jgi:hypothetical protein